VVSTCPQRAVLAVVVAQSRHRRHVLLLPCCLRRGLDATTHQLVREEVDQEEEASKKPVRAAVAATVLGRQRQDPTPYDDLSHLHSTDRHVFCTGTAADKLLYKASN